MQRRLTHVAALLVAVMLSANACSSSSGGSPTHSSSSRPTSPLISTGAPTTATSSPPTASPSPSWTAPAYGAAQPAVTAYLTLQGLSDKAFTDPTDISPTTFAQYVTGTAEQVFDAALLSEKQADRYYRGTPAEQRVTVTSMDLAAEPKSVVLYSCPLANSTDPFTEYDAKTGQPVPPGAPPTVKPPYGHTVKMIELSGQWTASEFTVDATKTCVP